MHALIRTARTTGLFYLGLAISGVLGFVVIRSRLFAADDPAATLAHLVDNQSLARAGVALELLIVLTQALAAIWFYRLFRTAAPLAASGIAAFGLLTPGTARPAPSHGQRHPLGRRRPLLRPVADPHGLLCAPLRVDTAPARLGARRR